MIVSQALAWAQVGISPIPLRSRSKVPAIGFWKPYVEKVPPEPLVRHWFKEERNLGLVLRGEYVVADFDNMGSFKVWEGRHPGLAKTYTVKTARGFHLYYRMGEKPERTVVFDRGELKVTGYVVAPPSVHPCGKVYEVARMMEILSIDSWRDLDLRDVFEFAHRGDAHPLPPSPGVGTVVRRIKEALPIETFLNRITTLYPLRDGRFRANCPFHEDHHPSMIVDLQWAHCFSSNCPTYPRQLDVINCYALWNRLPLREAIAELASQVLD